MLTFGSVMIGSSQPKVLAKFYEKVIGKSADWADESWAGWKFGDIQFMIGAHSEVHGKAKEPQREILNFETNEVKKEFERVSKLGAKVIEEPYEIDGGWIATFADSDGNYFQLMSPW